MGELMKINEVATKYINNIFQSKLLKMQDDINSLVYLKNVVSSIIKIRNEQNIE